MSGFDDEWELARSEHDPRQALDDLAKGAAGDKGHAWRRMRLPRASLRIFQPGGTRVVEP
jgi:hypothetical protein